MSITRPKGTYDILPGESSRWQRLFEQIHHLAGDFAYEEIVTPVFEHTELFERGVGQTTDVVEKEMYTFEDRGERSLTLRPEGTAPALRAFLEHGLFNEALPVKLYYLGPMFRYDKPQAGRYRQFMQFGVEALGSMDPAVDVEVMVMPLELLRRLGIEHLSIKLNSIGCPVCRPGYTKKLKAYYRQYEDQLCDDCSSRLERNPLRLLDCKEESCRVLRPGAPVITGELCEECDTHFQQVQAYLDQLDVDYELDPFIVRGLDYYTKTVFEVVHNGIGAQSSLLGGGRYDGLIEVLGGDPLPGVGFAAGLERLMLALEEEGHELPGADPLDLFIVTIGDDARQRAVREIYNLRRQGWSVDIDYLDRSVRAQMRYADKYPARYVVVLGGNELASGEVQVRDMQSGEETAAGLDELADFLADRVMA